MVQWVIENNTVITLLFTFVVAISTAVYAVLTARLVVKTQELRKAQTEPRLSVYFESIEEAVHFGHLYIKNIGMGPAYNIRFEITPEGSQMGTSKLIQDFCKTPFLLNGINYLAPEHFVKSGFTSFLDNGEEKLNSVLIVLVKYHNALNVPLEESFRVDFSELKGSGTLGKQSLLSIAKSLEAMQKDLHSLVTVKRLRVEVFDQEDREREQAEWEAQYQKQES